MRRVKARARTRRQEQGQGQGQRQGRHRDDVLLLQQGGPSKGRLLELAGSTEGDGEGHTCCLLAPLVISHSNSAQVKFLAFAISPQQSGLCCLTRNSTMRPSGKRSLHHCSFRSEKNQRTEDKLITLLEKVCCQLSPCLCITHERGEFVQQRKTKSRNGTRNRQDSP